MSDGNLFDTMQDISDAVTRATKTGDYSHLSASIKESVSDFANGVGDSVADFANDVGDSVARGAQDFADTIRGGAQQNQSASSGGYYRQRRGSGKKSGSTGRYSGTASSRETGRYHQSEGSGDADGYYQSAGSQQTGRYTAFGNRQTNLHEGDAVYESPYRKGNETDETIARIRREKAARGQAGADAESGSWFGQTGTNGGSVSYFLQTRPSRTRGLGRRIGGTIGSIVFGLFSIFNLMGFGISAVGADPEGMVIGGVLLAVTGAATAGSAYMVHKGKKEQKVTDRYYAYGRLVGSREFFSIEDLAGKARETAAQVRENILAMKQQGLLPHAELDRNQTTVMLTDQAMQQYAQAEQARQEREQDAKENNGNAADFSPDVQKILDDGNAYIRDIRAVNDRIPDTEEMSGKLYRLEDIMKQIFDKVQENPAKAKDIRKLMSYYLPTTMKLLNAYADLCEQPSEGENIRSTKREIEESMDSINSAFEKLLDDLFQDDAWDLTSDLNVMKTMMKQDGLMDEGDVKAKGTPLV